MLELGLWLWRVDCRLVLPAGHPIRQHVADRRDLVPGRVDGADNAAPIIGEILLEAVPDLFQAVDRLPAVEREHAFDEGDEAAEDLADSAPERPEPGFDRRPILVDQLGTGRDGSDPGDDPADRRRLDR